MKTQKAILLLTMVAIFITAILLLKMQFKNLCPFVVWPWIMTAGGNGPRLPHGFVVLSNTSQIFEVPDNWTNGRFWGQTDCGVDRDGYFHCLTGDCGISMMTCIDIEPKPWVTYMEFTLNGPGGYDYYNISLVNGFNLPIKIEVKYINHPLTQKKCWIVC
ncbi:Thaumatin-like protein 1a [Linum perenne]